MKVVDIHFAAKTKEAMLEALAHAYAMVEKDTDGEVEEDVHENEYNGYIDVYDTNVIFGEDE